MTRPVFINHSYIGIGSGCYCSFFEIVFCFSLIFGIFWGSIGYAQDDIPEKLELEKIQVFGEKAEFIESKVVIPDPGVAPTAKATSEDVKYINATTIEDNLKYLPSIDIRRRYIADPNGVVAIRGNGNFQTSRVMVFADGFPLHNLLQSRFNGAPKWNILAPDEMALTNVYYGPFNAKFSGNSMGGVIDIQTRQPQKREFTLQGSYFFQPYQLFGTDETLDGYRTFVSHGDKIGKLTYYMFYNRIENDGQPQQLRLATGSFSAGSSETSVTGAVRNEDTRLRDQIIYGDTGLDKTRNDLFKFKAKYDFSSQFAVRTTVAFLDRSREVNPKNYLRDASGNTIWGDNSNSTLDAQFNGEAFNVKNSNFGVEERNYQDILLGLGFEGDVGSSWSYDVALSYYDIIEDDRRQSDENPNDPLFDRSGRVTELEDSGWQTVDIKLGTPSFMSHEDLSFGFGYHYSHYSLESIQHNSSNFSTGSKDSLRRSSGGDTDIHGVYVQGEWRFHPQWDAVFGGRQEFWNSYDGFNDSSSSTNDHPDRNESEFSPKFSLGFKPFDLWQLRLSLSRAVRFPVVEELFSNISTQTSTSLANADLQPEDGFHKTFVVQRAIDRGLIQLNLFEDDIDDVIFNSVDLSTNVSTFLNLDRVRTRGIELVFNQAGFLHQYFDLKFNVAYLDSEILSNSRNTTFEGNTLPRIPDWRLKLLGTYHITPAWDSTLALRYSSPQFGRLQNDDTGLGFGGVSDFTVVDFKTSYAMKNGLTTSFGINNINDEEYFVFHPFPQRTFYLDVKWRF